MPEKLERFGGVSSIALLMLPNDLWRLTGLKGFRIAKRATEVASNRLLICAGAETGRFLLRYFRQSSEWNQTNANILFVSMRHDCACGLLFAVAQAGLVELERGTQYIAGHCKEYSWQAGAQALESFVSNLLILFVWRSISCPFLQCNPSTCDRNAEDLQQQCNQGGGEAGPLRRPAGSASIGSPAEPTSLLLETLRHSLGWLAYKII